jgi:hypothetical protein
MRPDVVSGLGDEISGLFLENITDTTRPEPKKEQPKKPADRQPDASQNR